MTPQDAARLLVDYIYENQSHEGPLFRVYDTDLHILLPGVSEYWSTTTDQFILDVTKAANERLDFEQEPFEVETSRQVDGWVVRFTGDRDQEEDAR